MAQRVCPWWLGPFLVSPFRRLLHDPRDVERLKRAFRLLSGLFDVPAVQAVTADPFFASFSEKVKQVAVINRKNAILTIKNDMLRAQER
jgi:hypothetical protein